MKPAQWKQHGRWQSALVTNDHLRPLIRQQRHGFARKRDGVMRRDHDRHFSRRELNALLALDFQRQ